MDGAGLKQYQVHAKELLKKLDLLRQWQDRHDGNRRSFIIEFAGMPKAGKSSAIETLRHFFSHGHSVKVAGIDNSSLDYRVHTPAEGVSLRTPQKLKGDSSDYNTWAGAYGLQELLEAAHDDYHDLVILDRGPWDAACWLEYAKQKNAAEEGTDADSIATFFQHERWMTRSDLHVVFVIEPKEAEDRERKVRLIEHYGFASKPDGMKTMRAIYMSRFEQLQKTKAVACPHVGDRAALLIDTTHKNGHQVAIEIIEAMFAVLEAKIAFGADAFHFTVEWITERIAGYYTKVRGKTATLAGLPEFVKQANALSPERRVKLAERIHDGRAPNTLLLAARSPESIMEMLYEHLQEVAQA